MNTIIEKYTRVIIQRYATIAGCLGPSESLILMELWGAQVKTRKNSSSKKTNSNVKKHDKEQSQYKNTFCYTKNRVEVCRWSRFRKEVDIKIYIVT